MTRPKLRPGRLCKAMRKTMAAVAEPGTRVPRLYRRWECVKQLYLEAKKNGKIITSLDKEP